MSHKIFFIPRLLVTPPLFFSLFILLAQTLVQFLVSLLPCPLLLSLLLPHPFLLYPLRLLQRMRRRAELFQVGFLVGGERVRGGDGSSFRKAVDDRVRAGRDESFEDLEVGG